MAQAKRLTGTVKWFNGMRGFGFISPDDGTDDLFVHQTAIQSEGFRALSEGDAVEFVVDKGEDGRDRAVEVTGPNGAALSGGGGRGRGGRGGGYRGRGGGGYYGGGRVGRGGRMGGGDYGSGGGRGFGGGAACYNCGRPGHLARDCYQGAGGGSGGRGRGGGGGGGGGCYSCGEIGHFARDCPNAGQ